MLQLVQDLRTGTVEVVEVPDPRPGPNEVVVRTAWSLISPGTEQAVSSTASKGWIGKARDRPEDVRRVVEKVRTDGLGDTVAAVRARLDELLTPGYSSAGVVEALGSGVAGLALGERVACIGRNAAVHAELAVVPAPMCIVLPDELPERYGAFCAVGAVAAHGVRLAGVEAGATVAVIGLGLVGQLAAQIATASGARVVGIDLSLERVRLAEQLGAVGGSTPERADEAVAAASLGHGADAVIITAATESAGPIELAAELARDRATICVVGDVALPVPRRQFYEKELQLRVSRSYGPGRYDPEYEVTGRDYPIGYVRWTERRLVRYFLEEVAAGRVGVADLVTHEFEIADGVDAYAALGDPSRLAILLRYEQGEPARPLQRSFPGTKVTSRSGALRVGLIGPGAFARSTLLPNLRALGVDLAAVAGTTPAGAFGTGRRWSSGYVSADPEELLGDASIDAVVIATRHDSHADLTARALAGGKAVFLEKPLAIDEVQLDRLRGLLEDGGGRLVVDFNRDFAPATQEVIRHFEGRREPIALSYRVNAGRVPPEHWTGDPDVGGGRLVGEGCHFVELCSAIVDAPLDGIAAVPMAGDGFMLTLRYMDGSVGVVAYAVGGSGSMRKERLEVLGGGRSAAIDDFRGVELYPSKARLPNPLARARNKGHRAILEAAVRFFREGGEPPIPYARLLETTRATLVARRSCASGTTALVSLAE